MVNPRFDLKSRLMLKKVCDVQLKVLKEISHIDNVIHRVAYLKSLDPNIDHNVYLEVIKKEARLYKKLKENPDNLFHIMDPVSVACLKTEILNLYNYRKPVTKKLLKKIFISEDVLTRLN